MFLNKTRITIMILLSILIIAVSFFLFKKTRTLPVVNYHSVAELEKQDRIIFLFRHGERCDRSDNLCLDDKRGITLSGASEARHHGTFL